MANNTNNNSKGSNLSRIQNETTELTRTRTQGPVTQLTQAGIWNSVSGAQHHLLPVQQVAGGQAVPAGPHVLLPAQPGAEGQTSYNTQCHLLSVQQTGGQPVSGVQYGHLPVLQAAGGQTLPARHHLLLPAQPGAGGPTSHNTQHRLLSVQQTGGQPVSGVQHGHLPIQQMGGGHTLSEPQPCLISLQGGQAVFSASGMPALTLHTEKAVMNYPPQISNSVYTVQQQTSAPSSTFQSFQQPVATNNSNIITSLWGNHTTTGTNIVSAPLTYVTSTSASVSQPSIMIGSVFSLSDDKDATDSMGTEVPRKPIEKGGTKKKTSHKTGQEVALGASNKMLSSDVSSAKATHPTIWQSLNTCPQQDPGSIVISQIYSSSSIQSVTQAAAEGQGNSERDQESFAAAESSEKTKLSTIASRNGEKDRPKSKDREMPTVHSGDAATKKGEKIPEVVDVDAEDVDDCMLVKIDLSRRRPRLPFSHRLHNQAVVIDDSDEDEAEVEDQGSNTRTKKSCEQSSVRTNTGNKTNINICSSNTLSDTNSGTVPLETENKSQKTDTGAKISHQQSSFRTNSCDDVNTNPCSPSTLSDDDCGTISLEMEVNSESESTGKGELMWKKEDVKTEKCKIDDTYMTSESVEIVMEDEKSADPPVYDQEGLQPDNEIAVNSSTSSDSLFIFSKSPMQLKNSSLSKSGRDPMTSQTCPNATCKKTFSSRKELVLHVLTCTASNMSKTDGPSVKYSCTKCGAAFLNTTMMKLHAKLACKSLQVPQTDGKSSGISACQNEPSYKSMDNPSSSSDNIGTELSNLSTDSADVIKVEPVTDLTADFPVTTCETPSSAQYTLSSLSSNSESFQNTSSFGSSDYQFVQNTSSTTSSKALSEHETQAKHCPNCMCHFADALKLKEHLSLNHSCRLYATHNSRIQEQRMQTSAPASEIKNNKILVLCCVCGLQFDNRAELAKHLNELVSCAKYFHMDFMKDSNMNDDVKKKEISKRYCFNCNRLFDSAADKEGHLENFKICKRRDAFLNKYKLHEPEIGNSSHKKSSNPVSQINRPTNNAGNLSSPFVARCVCCNLWLPSYASLVKHFQTSHQCKEHDTRLHSMQEKGKDKIDPSQKKPATASSTSLKVHLAELISGSRNKVLQSEDISYGKKQTTSDEDEGPSSEQHKDNILFKETAEITTKCKACQLIFDDDQELTQHIKASYSCQYINDKGRDCRIYKCQVCAMQFSSDEGLAKHVDQSKPCKNSSSKETSSKTVSIISTNVNVSVSQQQPSSQQVPKSSMPQLQQTSNQMLQQTSKQHSNQQLLQQPSSQKSSEQQPSQKDTETRKSQSGTLKGKVCDPQISRKGIDDQVNAENMHDVDNSSSEASGESMCSDKEGTSEDSASSSDDADIEYRCKICQNTFTHRSSLKKHMASHTRTPQANQKTRIRCRVCTKKFKDAIALQAHLFQSRFCFIPITKTLWWRKEASQSCWMCSKTFSSVKSLRKHCFKDVACKLRYIDQVLKNVKPQKDSMDDSSTTSDASEATKCRTSDNTNAEHQCIKKVPCPDVSTNEKGSSLNMKGKENDSDDATEASNEQSLCQKVSSLSPSETCTSQQFSCLECKTEFQSIRHLLEHSYKHLVEKPYVCERCNITFYHYNQLVSHEAFHMRMDKEANSKLTNNHTAHSHQDNEGSYVCLVCHQSFGSQESYKTHVLTHSRSLSYSCTICFQNFTTLEGLQSHKVQHEKSKTKPRESSPQSVLDAGLSMQQGKDTNDVSSTTEKLPSLLTETETSQQCLYCHQRLSQVNDKVTHVKDNMACRAVMTFLLEKGFYLHRTDKDRCSAEEAGKCEFCQQNTSDKVSHLLSSPCLRDFEEAVLRFREKPSPVTNSETVSSSEIKEEGMLSVGPHTETSEPESCNDSARSEELYCSVCHKNFEEKSHLKLHMSEEHKDYQYVRHHIKKATSHITDLKDFYCYTCGKRMSSTMEVEDHKTSHHNHNILSSRTRSYGIWGKKKLQCKLCVRSFVKRYSLVKHLLSHESEEALGRPAKFTLEGSHPKSVTKCSLCDKPFKKGNIDMKNHFHTHVKLLLRRLHEKSNKPLKQVSKETCLICNKVFLSRFNLKKHIFTHKYLDIYPEMHIAKKVLGKSRHSQPLSLQSLISKQKIGKRKSLGRCSLCHKSVYNLPNLRLHVKVAHKEVDPDNFMTLLQPDSEKAIKGDCTDGESPSSSSACLLQSSNVSVPPRPECRAGFSLRAARLAVLYCHICQKSIRAANYAKHLRDIHHCSEDALYRCTLCQLVFPSSSFMKDHVIQCEKACQCAECGRNMGSIRGMRNHIILYHRMNWHEYMYQQLSQNVIEIDNGGQKISSISDEQYIANKQDILRVCFICQEEFSSALPYQDHLKTHLKPCEVVLDKTESCIKDKIEVKLEIDEEMDEANIGDKSLTESDLKTLPYTDKTLQSSSHFQENETAASLPKIESPESDKAEDTTSNDVAEDTTSTNVAEDTTSTNVAEDTTSNDVAEDTTNTNVAEDTTNTNVAEDTTSTDVAEDTTSANVAEDTTTTDVAVQDASNNIKRKLSSESDESEKSCLYGKKPKLVDNDHVSDTSAPRKSDEVKEHFTDSRAGAHD